MMLNIDNEISKSTKCRTHLSIQSHSRPWSIVPDVHHEQRYVHYHLYQLLIQCGHLRRCHSYEQQRHTFHLEISTQRSILIVSILIVGILLLRRTLRVLNLTHDSITSGNLCWQPSLTWPETLARHHNFIWINSVSPPTTTNIAVGF